MATVNDPVASGVTDVVVVSGAAVVVGDVTDVVRRSTTLCEAVSDESVVTETVRSPTPAVVVASVLAAVSDDVNAAVCNGVTAVAVDTTVSALTGTVKDGVPSTVGDAVDVAVLSAVTPDDTAVVVSAIVAVVDATVDVVVLSTVRAAVPVFDEVTDDVVSTATSTLAVSSDVGTATPPTTERVSVDAVFGRATVSVSGPETSDVVVTDAVTDCCVSVASWNDVLTVESVVVDAVALVDVREAVVVVVVTFDVAVVVSEIVSPVLLYGVVPNADTPYPVDSPTNVLRTALDDDAVPVTISSRHSVSVLKTPYTSTVSPLVQCVLNRHVDGRVVRKVLRAKRPRENDVVVSRPFTVDNVGLEGNDGEEPIDRLPRVRHVETDRPTDFDVAVSVDGQREVTAVERHRLTGVVALRGFTRDGSHVIRVTETVRIVVVQPNVDSRRPGPNLVLSVDRLLFPFFANVVCSVNCHCKSKPVVVRAATVQARTHHRRYSSVVGSRPRRGVLSLMRTRVPESESSHAVWRPA